MLALFPLSFFFFFFNLLGGVRVVIVLLLLFHGQQGCVLFIIHHFIGLITATCPLVDFRLEVIAGLFEHVVILIVLILLGHRLGAVLTGPPLDASAPNDNEEEDAANECASQQSADENAPCFLIQDDTTTIGRILFQRSIARRRWRGRRRRTFIGQDAGRVDHHRGTLILNDYRRCRPWW